MLSTGYYPLLSSNSVNHANAKMKQEGFFPIIVKRSIWLTYV
uniref:Uncharacterized protein n=1 Tax=Arundo donax TaxID=35708 RepID=A0A0A9FVH5_ARUDO